MNKDEYIEYLKSEHWKSFKKRYKKAKSPQFCLGCGNKRIQLHHRTYARLGKERYEDIFPLCGKCHIKLHKFLSDNKQRITASYKKSLAILFKWTPIQRSIFKKFYRKRTHKKCFDKRFFS